MGKAELPLTRGLRQQKLHKAPISSLLLHPRTGRTAPFCYAHTYMQLYCTWQKKLLIQPTKLQGPSIVQRHTSGPMASFEVEILHAIEGAICSPFPLSRHLCGTFRLPSSLLFSNGPLPSPQQFIRCFDIHSAQTYALLEGPSSPDWFLGALLGPYE
jgi:hypothetical protein